MKAIRCRCGCIYPDDMTMCPSCQCATDNNSSHVLTGSKAPMAKNAKQAVREHDNNTYYSSQLTTCVACNNQISAHAESCPQCGHPTGVHVCPKCGSTNTKVISGASKATSIFLWGPFAANKVISKFQCKDCGHKW